MANILSYIRKEQRTFNEYPFNRVDGLILGWISYFNFPNYLEKIMVPLNELPLRGLYCDKDMFKDSFKPKSGHKFWIALLDNPRFKDLLIGDYLNILDFKKREQYASLTIRLDMKNCLLTFRGTDPSFLGWREDFDLAYLDATPSQIEALACLKKEMVKNPNASFVLAGHSKGGNLAIYSYFNSSESERKRISKVDSYDSPGFLIERGFSPEDDRIIEKYVPQSSFVGMLFKDKENYQVIKSNSYLTLQHDPFSFAIKKNDFIKKKRRTRPSNFLVTTINDWIFGLTAKERERLIGIIFNALSTLKVNNFTAFFKKGLSQIHPLSKAYRGLNPSDKKFFKITIKKLLKQGRLNLVLLFKDKKKVKK